MSKKKISAKSEISISELVEQYNSSNESYWYSPILNVAQASHFYSEIASCNNFTPENVANFLTYLSKRAEIVVGAEYSPVVYLFDESPILVNPLLIVRIISNLIADEINFTNEREVKDSKLPPYMKNKNWLRLWWD